MMTFVDKLDGVTVDDDATSSASSSSSRSSRKSKINQFMLPFLAFDEPSNNPKPFLSSRASNHGFVADSEEQKAKTEAARADQSRAAESKRQHVERKTAKDARTAAVTKPVLNPETAALSQATVAKRAATKSALLVGLMNSQDPACSLT